MEVEEHGSALMNALTYTGPEKVRGLIHGSRRIWKRLDEALTNTGPEKVRGLIMEVEEPTLGYSGFVSVFVAFRLFTRIPLQKEHPRTEGKPTSPVAP
jgi:hypothetical protein